MNLFNFQTFCIITVACNTNIRASFIFSKNQMVVKRIETDQQRQRKQKRENGKEACWPGPSSAQCIVPAQTAAQPASCLPLPTVPCPCPLSPGEVFVAD